MIENLPLVASWSQIILTAVALTNLLITLILHWEIKIVRHETNGMKDDLVKSEKKAALAKGILKGKASKSE